MTSDTSNDELLLHALADSELDAATTLRLERRIGNEPALAAAYDRILALKGAVTRLRREPVSDAFNARILALAPSRPKAAPKREIPRRTWTAFEWRAMAASVVAAAVLASATTYSLVAPSASSAIEEAVLSGHRRSLLSSSPIDIASSDRHTVRPWLDAKLGVAPPTPDLADLGFPLVGGRVDVVAGRPVPSLVYRHKDHLITVVAFPASPGDKASLNPASSQSGGYNVIRWSQAGFGYWAVSDLDADELAAFVGGLRVR